MPVCQACGQEPAVYHVTVSVVVVGPSGSRSKPVQFTLGEKCELNLRQVMARDEYLKVRIAGRLTDAPEYKSGTPVKWSKAWRNLPAIVPNGIE